MLNHASPANATPLPAVLALVGAARPDPAELISPRAIWAASIGRLSADCAALMFPLPVAGHVQRMFEDAVRQEVTADLLSVAHLSDEERHQIEDIAWLAFDHRLALHMAAGQGRGKA